MGRWSRKKSGIEGGRRPPCQQCMSMLRYDMPMRSVVGHETAIHCWQIPNRDTGCSYVCVKGACGGTPRCLSKLSQALQVERQAYEAHPT